MHRWNSSADTDSTADWKALECSYHRHRNNTFVEQFVGWSDHGRLCGTQQLWFLHKAKSRNSFETKKTTRALRHSIKLLKANLKKWNHFLMCCAVYYNTYLKPVWICAGNDLSMREFCVKLLGCTACTTKSDLLASMWKSKLPCSNFFQVNCDHINSCADCMWVSSTDQNVPFVWLDDDFYFSMWVFERNRILWLSGL